MWPVDPGTEAIFTLLAGLHVRREPQFAIVVAGDPEGVIAAGRRKDVAANPAAVGIRPVGRRVETRQVQMAGRIVRIIGVAGQIRDRRSAADVQPVVVVDLSSVSERHALRGQRSAEASLHVADG